MPTLKEIQDQAYAHYAASVRTRLPAETKQDQQAAADTTARGHGPSLKQHKTDLRYARYED